MNSILDNNYPRSFQLIPYEIIENICRLILSAKDGKRNLVNCALVCHSWYLPACRVLYERLDVYNRERILAYLSSQKKNLGHFCKTLQIVNEGYSENLPFKEYKEFLSCLPNLQVLIVGFRDRVYDLEQLAQHAYLIKHVKNITLFGYTHWMPEESQAYYDCAIAFSKTLQHLKINSPGATITTANGETGHMITLLSDFTSLTSMEVVNRMGVDAPSLPRLCMFQVMGACPNLVNFTISNEYQEPEVDHGRFHFDHSNLRHLDIILPEITKQQVEYMVANVKNLTKLRIWNAFQRPLQLKEKFGPDLLYLLQKYLAGITKVDFLIRENFRSTTTDYWSFMNGIYDSKSMTPAHLSMTICNLNTHSSEAKMNLSKNAQYTYLHCGIDIEELTSFDNNLASQKLLQNMFASLDSSKNERIQSYFIRFKADSEDEEKRIYKYHVNILHLLIFYFINLHNLNIRISSSQSLTSQIGVASNDINDAANNDINYHPDKKLIPQYPTGSSTKFAYVTLKSIQSAKEITSILNALPNTKYLTLLDCVSDLDDQFNFAIDLNALHLLVLKVDISSLALKGQSKHLFVFQFEEQKLNRKSYFKWQRESKRFTHLKFDAVEANFLAKYKRKSSSNCNIIKIKCNRIEQVIISSKNSWSSTKDIYTTLDLTT